MNNYIEKIEFVDLVLENCEVYRIAKEDFHSLVVIGIKTDAFVNVSGQFHDHQRCEEVIIKLKNKDYKTLQETDYPDFHIPFTKRMEKYRDITSVCVIGKNEKEEKVEFQYSVPFYDKYEDKEINCENLWQVVSYERDYIVIKIKNLSKDQ
jgi:hypothetical protein